MTECAVCGRQVNREPNPEVTFLCNTDCFVEYLNTQLPEIILGDVECGPGE